MQSKNKPAQNADERRHVARLARMCCVVCGDSPVQVHEIKQGDWFTSIPICQDCHTGEHNGWHGRRDIWNVYKMDLLDALNETYRRIYKDKGL